jgi:hypothetical protein
MRLPFYNVSPDRYLVRLKNVTDTVMPEEAVRQWCAYELIRDYGVCVEDLEFEAQVQIGHKPKRIDILVRRSGKAWAVIECKPAKHKDAIKALTQAESYATAPSVRAEFVVYTNGNDWVVRRNVRGTWIRVVDLPRQHDQINSTEDAAQLLRDIDDVKPLLAKIDTPVKGKEAQAYFASLQVFFCGANLFTFRVSKELRIALDLLLRVISTRQHEDRHYELGKLFSAAESLESFRKSIGGAHEIWVGEKDNPDQIIQTIYTSLSMMLEPISNVRNYDSLAARCALVFTAYGRRQKPELFPETSHALHQAVRDFIELGFAVGLNAKLPDPIDSAYMSDLRSAAYIADPQET